MVHLLALLIIVFYLAGCYAFIIRSSSKGWKSPRDALVLRDQISEISYLVGDLEKSVDFYSLVFGMNLIKNSEGDAQSALLSFPTESLDAVKLSLLSTSGVKSYDIGNAFAGIGLKLPSASKIFGSALDCNAHKDLITEFGDYAYGASLVPDEDEMKQFPAKYGRLRDPDGYPIEVIEYSKKKVFQKIIVNVLDLEESIGFYTGVLGMKLLRKRSNINSKPKHASLCAFVGYGEEVEGPILELVYNYATDKLDHGNGFVKLVIKKDDVNTAKEECEKAGKILEPQENGGFTLKDPNGYSIKVIPGV